MNAIVNLKGFFLILLIASLCWTCTPTPEIEIVPNRPVQSEQPTNLDTITYLALGDSYTIGQSVSVDGRWPNQLGRRLNNQERVLFPIDIIARTGWTTGNLLRAIADEAPGPYDLVSLLIGVNNQFQNQTFEQFEVEFDSLLNISIAIAGTKERVFVVSIPDYGVTPFGQSNSQQIATELDAYNAFIDQQCQLKGVPFINITDISRALGVGPGALAPDALHPSADQYKAWVDRIRPLVDELLKD